MGSDDEDHYDEGYRSTNEAYRNDDNPGNNPDLVDEPEGYSEDEMLGSESPWDAEQMESDARGPDRYYNNPPEEGSDDEGDGAKSDDAKSKLSNDDGYGYGYGSYDDNGNSGYDGDRDSGDSVDDTVQSEQASAETPSLGPEAEHPATLEHMTNPEKNTERLTGAHQASQLAPAQWVRQRGSAGYR